MVIIKTFLKIILVLCIILFIFSYFMKNRLPDESKLDDSLYSEPVQNGISSDPIILEEKNVKYTIEPKYSYELRGLVVSVGNKEVWYSQFRERDPLNTIDLCVVWGENLEDNIYQKIEFRNGEFTCFAEPKSRNDRETYSKFSFSHISNNHLLPKDDEIYKKLKTVNPGDQIYLSGNLSSYTTEKDGEIRTRGTSAVRDDQGNGACETIYIEDFEVLRGENKIFKNAYLFSKYLICLCLFVSIGLYLFLPEKTILEK